MTRENASHQPFEWDLAQDDSGRFVATAFCKTCGTDVTAKLMHSGAPEYRAIAECSECQSELGEA